ncbi:predicted protein [Nematostella vectensis]|uniref:RRM domain-containing protein n=1 Tax=Nematostella vectensis TaxID=45351 RepID=A7SQW0_NEMVE|nr:predicted protein [Nematostella vectensis]|eukprot:XP_001626026.1 predicted protein [Nematostella vectensis]
MAEDFDIEAMLEAPYKKEWHSRGRRDDRRGGKRRSFSRSKSRTPPRHRRRSRSPNKKHSRSKSRTPPRHRRRSRSPRRESIDRKRRSSYESPSPQPFPSPVRKPPEPMTEESAEEKDQRTVFCMQLARNIRPRDLEEFFSKVGQVSDVRIISDRNSRRSKGIAYIEFTDKSAVPLAIGLSGQKLLGAPIMVMLTQAEKNRLAAEAERLKQPLGPTRLYVGSLHFNITEAMVKAVFEPFGTVDSVQLIYDSETNRSKGYGFVQFREAEAAKRAMEQMNGFELAGRPLKIGPVTERGDSSAYSFLDDEEYEKGGVELNSSARAALMAKLSQGHSAGLSVPGAPPIVSGVQQALATPVAVSLPTPCFMLTNMFDPTKERDAGWDLDIRDDVLEECNKFGPIVHIHVDKNSPQGIVYVKCATPDIAISASKSLHGRWFAGKQIIAAPVPLSNYHTMFPQSISATRSLQPSTA